MIFDFERINPASVFSRNFQTILIPVEPGQLLAAIKNSFKKIVSKEWYVQPHSFTSLHLVAFQFASRFLPIFLFFGRLWPLEETDCLPFLRQILNI